MLGVEVKWCDAPGSADGGNFIALLPRDVLNSSPSTAVVSLSRACSSWNDVLNAWTARLVLCAPATPLSDVPLCISNEGLEVVVE